ncbi:hypothetical protein HRbin21_01310 [bacterium HR21]|nr:hypothetical protein HRbin21_01310 [bacterium HR21]
MFFRRRAPDAGRTPDTPHGRRGARAEDCRSGAECRDSQRRVGNQQDGNVATGGGHPVYAHRTWTPGEVESMALWRCSQSGPEGSVGGHAGTKVERIPLRRHSNSGPPHTCRKESQVRRQQRTALAEPSSTEQRWEPAARLAVPDIQGHVLPASAPCSAPDQLDRQQLQTSSRVPECIPLCASHDPWRVCSERSRKGRNRSMGIGKMMVEFFSEAISVSVCRNRS